VWLELLTACLGYTGQSNLDCGGGLPRAWGDLLQEGALCQVEERIEIEGLSGEQGSRKAS
jgi:hypothetical protein